MRRVTERRHSTLDEVRILLVHGLLHLLGFDHERGPKEAADMARAEAQVLSHLKWQVCKAFVWLVQAAARLAYSHLFAGVRPDCCQPGRRQ